VPTKISQVFLSLFDKNHVCLATFPMSLVIISKHPSVPTNISNVFSHYLQRSRCLPTFHMCFIIIRVRSRCAYQLLPCVFNIIWWDSGVPTKISHGFYLYLVTSRCAYQDFTWVLSLIGEIQVCLPIFPMSFNLCLLKSRCGYQHFHLCQHFYFCQLNLCLLSGPIRDFSQCVKSKHI